MRRLFAIVSIWLFLAGSLFAKEVTIRGFVTDVKSPTVFEIDDYKITRDRSLAIDISAEEDDKSRTAFKPEDLRIGTELEVKGDYDESTGELKAKSIKVIFEDARKLRRTALLEQLPSLTKKGSGWEGEIRADGQRIHSVAGDVPHHQAQQVGAGKFRRQQKRRRRFQECAADLP